MFSTGFSMDDRAHRRAGRRPERAVPRRAGRARTACGCAARCPSVQPRRRAARRTRSSSPRPTARSHRYAKIHPFTLRRRARALRRRRRARHRRGRGRPRARLFVCYDLRFADEFWALARRHRLLRRASRTGPQPRRDHWRTLLRARAIENQAYVVGVNRVGSGGGLDYAGDSAIVLPFGRTLEASDAGGRGDPPPRRHRRRGRRRARQVSVPRRPPLRRAAGPPVHCGIGRRPRSSTPQ